MQNFKQILYPALIVTSLILSACSQPLFNSNGSAAKQVSDNLISSERWSASADPYGSTIHPQTSGLIQAGILSARLQQTQASPDHNWPFVELICALPSNLSSVQSLELRYRASTPLHIKLSQSDFSIEGDESYAHFAAIIPASAEWQTRFINISEFQQPYWTPDAAKAVGLKLSNIRDIYISPNFGEQGGQVELQISKMTLHY